MDVACLARAAIDDKLSASEFLQFVREARRESDWWVREFAANAFVQKCATATPREWEEVKAALQGNSPEEVYLFKIGMLGRLSWDFSNPTVAAEHAEIIRWLINQYPGDSCLGQPYGCDVDDRWYQIIKPEWLAKADEYADDVRALSNAASFFFRRDKELAEQMYSRCAALEPDNDFWKKRLNKLREFHAPRVE